jgi:hypothetical protein
MRIFGAVLLAIFLIPLHLRAGVPEPMAFDSLSLSVNLGEPYGKATLIVNCSTDQDLIERKFTSIRLVTQKGEFTVAPELFVGYNNPKEVSLYSWSRRNFPEFYIGFYFISPAGRRVYTRHAFEFKNDKFKIASKPDIEDAKIQKVLEQKRAQPIAAPDAAKDGPRR